MINTQIATRHYDGFPIQFHNIGGAVYADATEMCKPFGKRPNDFLSTPEAKRYAEAVTRKSGNADFQVVITQRGGFWGGGKTLVHEKLILRLAQWLDVEFELWCDEQIATLFREGTVSLGQRNTDEAGQLSLPYHRPVDAAYVERLKDEALSIALSDTGLTRKLRRHLRKNISLYRHLVAKGGVR